MTFKTSRCHSTYNSAKLHTHFVNVTYEELLPFGEHVNDMRLYEGEGRHEEQSGTGRQAGRRKQNMMMRTMTTTWGEL